MVKTQANKILYFFCLMNTTDKRDGKKFNLVKITTMDTKDKIALATAIIGGAGLIFTVYKFVWERKSKRLDSRAKVIESLQDLKDRFLRTSFFDHTIHDETWQYGFDSLEITADKVSRAAALSEHSKFVEKELSAAIVALNTKIQNIRMLRSSYLDFAHDKKESARDIQAKWPDLEKANAAFTASKPVFENCKKLLGEFLREIDKT